MWFTPIAIAAPLLGSLKLAAERSAAEAVRRKEQSDGIFHLLMPQSPGVRPLLLMQISPVH